MSEFTLKQKLDMWQRAAIGEAPTNVTITPEYVVELHNDVKELYDRIAELESAQRWRVVADGELPETYRPVLTVDMSTATQVPVPAFYNPDTECWSTHFKYDLWVTHWVPLPQLPEERER